MPQISMQVIDRGHKRHFYLIHAGNNEIQPSYYSNVAFLPPFGSNMDPERPRYEGICIDCSPVSIGTLNFDNACHPCKLKGDSFFVCENRTP